MKKWETKDGLPIKVKDMETSHIENCIKMLEKRLEEGNGRVTKLMQYGGMGSDNMDVWYEEEEEDITEETKEWIKVFKKELKNRLPYQPQKKEKDVSATCYICGYTTKSFTKIMEHLHSEPKVSNFTDKLKTDRCMKCNKDVYPDHKHKVSPKIQKMDTRSANYPLFNLEVIAKINEIIEKINSS